MQLNEIHDNHEHASTSLKTILLVFAIVLVGTLGYLVWDFNRTADTTDYSTSVTTKKVDNTVADENRVALDKEKTHYYTLPTGFAAFSGKAYDGELLLSDSSLPNTAEALSFNLGKTVKGIAVSAYQSSAIPLLTGFSGKAETLRRVIRVREFDFVVKDADLLPAGQDRTPATGSVKTEGLVNGYFSAAASSLRAVSNCSSSPNAIWIPLEKSTVELTIYECNMTQIDSGVEEGEGSRPDMTTARSELGNLINKIVTSIKKGS